MPAETQVIYAFLAIQPDGSEGLMAEMLDGRWYPFVTTTESGRESLSRRVQSIEAPSTVRLVRFERKDVLKTFPGRSS